MTALRRSVFTALAGAMAAALLFSLATAYNAEAGHEPANKGAAAGSDLDSVHEDTLLLSETMKVSSPEDLVISVTAECSILTELTTNNDSLNSFAYGSVRLWVEVDGTPVPVAVDDDSSSEDDAADDDDGTGEVTFCNRAYERTVADEEDPADGVDEEHDYIRTRTANAFNWLALDTGVLYDSPDNGNNIITVELFADFDTSTAGDAVADAFVGSRTMVIEPIRLSIHEQVGNDGGAGS